MQNKKQSQKICCWKCNKISSHDIDMAGEPTLILTCPFCRASFVINLAPFQRQETFIYRNALSNSMQSQMPGIKTYDLPEILGSSALASQ